MVKFSNPRLYAEIKDYPIGLNKRGTCVFSVEHHPKRGYRVSRVTTGKPKYTTYGGRCAIVDGDDGRTYIVQFAGVYDFIQVHRSDFMAAQGTLATDKDPNKHAAWPEDECYAELKSLIDNANPVEQIGPA